MIQVSQFLSNSQLIHWITLNVSISVSVSLVISWAHIDLPCSFGALLVDDCGARAVSCKTPIYFFSNYSHCRYCSHCSHCSHVVIAKSRRHSLTHWQRHLLSCPGQLQICQLRTSLVYICQYCTDSTGKYEVRINQFEWTIKRRPAEKGTAKGYTQRETNKRF